MSYLKDLRAELNALFVDLLPDVPEEKRDVVVDAAVDGAYQSYKNGVAKGKETPAKSAPRRASATTKRRQSPRK
ncbi:MAG: hypothetical protein MI920_16030 [Kiloniellales bacterium]|nr:hypothetical protein [Kiloniellales bacterium]